ncbi:MAG: sigma-70 family RNA polymerase sigma factor [Bacteroidota bacterium]|nr:sigma-70 family RNA polymerase sigma factor [Bacteroidota bacterium]
MKAEPLEIYELFENIVNDHQGLYHRLLAAAHCRLRHSFTGRRECVIEAEDVINTIFEKLYSGERTWDKEKYPCFESYFFMLIRSLVYNVALHEYRLVPFTENYVSGKSETRTLPAAMNALDNSDDDFPTYNKPLRESVQWDDCPPELAMQELETLCLKKLEHDADAGIIFLGMLDKKTNKEIAEDLGIGVSAVENAKKRIQRKLRPVYQECFGGKQKKKFHHKGTEAQRRASMWRGAPKDE